MIHYYLLSIPIIAAIFYFLRRKGWLRICAVCAGVAGTWILGVAAKNSGYAFDPIFLAVMMGGSIVGLMYQIERSRGGNMPFLAKLLMLLSGFFAVYNLLGNSFRAMTLGIIIWALTYIFLVPQKLRGGPTKEDIERRMIENCCD